MVIFSTLSLTKSYAFRMNVRSILIIYMLLSIHWFGEDN